MKHAIAVLFATTLAAQTPNLTPSPSSAAELVARRLANADAVAADAAMVDLIRGGPANVSVLKSVLAAAKEPACRARAERALALCVVDAPVANGLKIGLAADKKEIAPGQAVTLTATVCNVTDKPISLYLGMSYSGNVLQNGLALQQCTAAGETLGQGRFGSVGFCGTGAQRIVEVLPPWSSKPFSLTATYRVEPDGKGVIQHDGPHLAVDYGFLALADAKAGDTLRLRIGWTVDPTKPDGFTPKPPENDWKGELRSNVVELRVQKPQ